MDTKQAREQKIRVQLDQLDARFAELKAKAAEATAETQTQYDQQLKMLDQKRDAIQQNLQDFKSASDDAWQDIMGGLDTAVSELKSAFDSAAARFK